MPQRGKSFSALFGVEQFWGRSCLKVARVSGHKAIARDSCLSIAVRVSVLGLAALCRNGMFHVSIELEGRFVQLGFTEQPWLRL